LCGSGSDLGAVLAAPLDSRLIFAAGIWISMVASTAVRTAVADHGGEQLVLTMAESCRREG
jgi:hypothetical protein